MANTSQTQEPIFPEYKKFKIFTIVWCCLVVAIAVDLNIWSALPRGTAETKTCSVYGYKLDYGENSDSPRFSTLECGDLYLRSTPTAEEEAFYESLVGKRIQADVLVYQTGFTPQGNMIGTPIVEGTLKAIE